MILSHHLWWCPVSISTRPISNASENMSKTLLDGFTLMLWRHLRFLMFKMENYLLLPAHPQVTVLPVLPVFRNGTCLFWLLSLYGHPIISFPDYCNNFLTGVSIRSCYQVYFSSLLPIQSVYTVFSFLTQPSLLNILYPALSPLYYIGKSFQVTNDLSVIRSTFSSIVHKLIMAFLWLKQHCVPFHLGWSHGTYVALSVHVIWSHA